jgi:hypothetical protein
MKNCDSPAVKREAEEKTAEMTRTHFTFRADRPDGGSIVPLIP